MSGSELKIHEIFFSIQGESLLAGKPTVFVRTTACNLRCTWCDTTHAYYEGNQWSLEKILNEVKKYPTRYVCVTGGEPLAQPQTIELLKALLRENYTVSLETNGSLSVEKVPVEVIKVIDIKCPDSGESRRMDLGNIDRVQSHDQFKFVVSSRGDFDWAADFIKTRNLEKKCTLLFSPSFGKVAPKDLAEWILKSGLQVTMQMQLHKLIWGEHEKGV